MSPLPSNSGRLTTVDGTPADTARTNTGSTGCHSAGSGSASHRMWLSTRSVPGTFRKNPTIPCAPGGTPVPRVTRLVGVVDGNPAVRVAEPGAPMN